jgi:hypothetical protein
MEGGILCPFRDGSGSLNARYDNDVIAQYMDYDTDGFVRRQSRPLHRIGGGGRRSTRRLNGPIPFEAAARLPARLPAGLPGARCAAALCLLVIT